jgi:hypothetical protein
MPCLFADDAVNVTGATNTITDPSVNRTVSDRN